MAWVCEGEYGNSPERDVDLFSNSKGSHGPYKTHHGLVNHNYDVKIMTVMLMRYRPKGIIIA